MFHPFTRLYARFVEDERLKPKTHFVTCPECNGTGSEVIARRGGFGRFPDGSEDNEELLCQNCDGTGEVER